MRSTASAADLRLSSNKGRGALPSDTQLDLGARLEAAVKGLARHEKSLLRYADTLKRAHERLKVKLLCPPPLPTVAPTRVPTVHSLPPSLAGGVRAGTAGGRRGPRACAGAARPRGGVGAAGGGV